MLEYICFSVGNINLNSYLIIRNGYSCLAVIFFYLEKLEKKNQQPCLWSLGLVQNGITILASKCS